MCPLYSLRWIKHSAGPTYLNLNHTDSTYSKHSNEVTKISISVAVSSFISRCQPCHSSLPSDTVKFLSKAGSGADRPNPHPSPQATVLSSGKWGGASV